MRIALMRDIAETERVCTGLGRIPTGGDRRNGHTTQLAELLLACRVSSCGPGCGQQA